MSAQPQPSGLALPTTFPDPLFEAVKNRIIAKMPASSPEQACLAGGHNGVRYRLRACADYSEEFIECVRRAGDAPPPEDRYRQERQLFGFFVSGIAALDSFNFFIYFAAAHLRPSIFLTQKAWLITRPRTAPLLRAEFPGEAITIALNNLVYNPKQGPVSNADLEEWETYRNILAHRSAPGRTIYASIGGSAPDPAADWKIDPTKNLKIDANLTPPRLAWLVTTMSDLVVAADHFVQKYF